MSPASNHGRSTLVSTGMGRAAGLLLDWNRLRIRRPHMSGPRRENFLPSEVNWTEYRTDEGTAKRARDRQEHGTHGSDHHGRRDRPAKDRSDDGHDQSGASADRSTQERRRPDCRRQIRCGFLFHFAFFWCDTSVDRSQSRTLIQSGTHCRA
jgi:hypothetical protein